MNPLVSDSIRLFSVAAYLFLVAEIGGTSVSSVCAGATRSNCLGCHSGGGYSMSHVHATGCGYHCGQIAANCCGIGIGPAGIAGACRGWSPPATAGDRSGYYPGDSWFTGYEGLPLMDGSGVHYRYPYHSYRRPWFHPGPPAVNISIVW